MHTISHSIRARVRATKADGATQAALLKIYQETGKLKSVAEFRLLDEHERHIAVSAVDEYMNDHHHPVRAMHAPIHYGRIVFWLSIIYYGSLVIWLLALLNLAQETHKNILWPAVGSWLVFISVLNVALTLYGIYLENRAYRHTATNGQRMVSAVAIIVLIIAILGNVIAPYSGSADENAPAAQIFLQQ